MTPVYGITVVAAAAILLWRLITRVTVLQGNVALLYRNGRFRKVLEPGVYFFPRIGTRHRLINTQLHVMTVPGQEVLTEDNVGIKTTLAIRFRVSDAERFAHVAADACEVLRTAAQLALRSAVGSRTIEQLLRSRTAIGAEMLPELAAQAAAVGIRIESVDIKDVMFAGDLKRSFADVIKAQQEARAAVERARGESAALRNLANAARLLEANPALMNARMLQTLDGDSRNTLVLGWPQELLTPATGRRNDADRNGGKPEGRSSDA